MAWIGMIAIALHYLAPDAGWVQALNGFLKWMALMIGVPQAFAFLFHMTEKTGLTEAQGALLLAWSIANIAAFFIIRGAEQERLEARRQRVE